jgi:hypothetical protein
MSLLYKAIRHFAVVLIVIVYSLTFGVEEVYSNSAVMPISIQVNGKLIITDENTEVDSNERSRVVENINIDRSKSNFDLSNSYTLRVRSNESRWKLIGHLQEVSVKQTKKINPKFIRLTYKTSAGSAGNINSAMLAAPFTEPVRLSNIPRKSDFVVLEGSSKTSLQRDKGNKNNWYGLSFNVDFVGKNGLALESTNPIYRKKKYNAIVSYTLVSL